MEVDYPVDERQAHAQLDRYAEVRRGRHTSGAKRSSATGIPRSPCFASGASSISS